MAEADKLRTSGNWRPKLTNFGREVFTLPTAEILSVKNERAFLVCGFLMKSSKKKYPENVKKIVGAVWKLPAK